jgi:hypothetical protein
LDGNARGSNGTWAAWSSLPLSEWLCAGGASPMRSRWSVLRAYSVFAPSDLPRYLSTMPI